MTETEAIILSNQATIMAAIGVLVQSPMRDALISACEQTLKYVEKHSNDLGQSSKIQA